MNSQVKRYLAEIWNGPSAGASVPVELRLANLETHQIAWFKSFYRALISSPTSSPPLPKDWWLRCKFPLCDHMIFLVTSPLKRRCSISSCVLKGLVMKSKRHSITWKFQVL